ncbi:hypothetical protein BGW38_010922 [Lunasporangiospora selenospora]|uniref:Uncharacterized protein n=1 Tax=Lunasporangiospora selenospora TaxID=979761 RepID=A0A9P6FW96_9FUNG|nr:hypothetical protein BGW38_010922 [Lunasporangiospora selenospora]
MPPSLDSVATSTSLRVQPRDLLDTPPPTGSLQAPPLLSRSRRAIPTPGLSLADLRIAFTHHQEEHKSKSQQAIGTTSTSASSSSRPNAQQRAREAQGQPLSGSNANIAVGQKSIQRKPSRSTPGSDPSQDDPQDDSDRNARGSRRGPYSLNNSSNSNLLQMDANGKTTHAPSRKEHLPPVLNMETDRVRKDTRRRAPREEASYFGDGVEKFCVNNNDEPISPSTASPTSPFSSNPNWQSFQPPTPPATSSARPRSLNPAVVPPRRVAPKSQNRLSTLTPAGATLPSLRAGTGAVPVTESGAYLKQGAPSTANGSVTSLGNDTTGIAMNTPAARTYAKRPPPGLPLATASSSTLSLSSTASASTGTTVVASSTRPGVLLGANTPNRGSPDRKEPFRPPPPPKDIARRGSHSKGHGLSGGSTGTGSATVGVNTSAPISLTLSFQQETNNNPNNFTSVVEATLAAATMAAGANTASGLPTGPVLSRSRSNSAQGATATLKERSTNHPYLHDRSSSMSSISRLQSLEEELALGEEHPQFQIDDTTSSLMLSPTSSYRTSPPPGDLPMTHTAPERSRSSSYGSLPNAFGTQSMRRLPSLSRPRTLKSALVKTPIAKARAREAHGPRKVIFGDMITIVTVSRIPTPPPPPPPDKKRKKKPKPKGASAQTGPHPDPEYDSDYHNEPYTPEPAEVEVTLAPWIGNPNYDEERLNSRFYMDNEDDEDEDYDEYEDYDDYDDEHGSGAHGRDDLEDDDEEYEDEYEDETGGGGRAWGQGIAGGMGSIPDKKQGGMFKFKRAVNRLLRT